MATALRKLHVLTPPSDPRIGPLEPFVRLPERIDAAVSLPEADREWLRAHLVELQRRYRDLPQGLPPCVVHGDAWVGNVVATDNRQIVLLDLERCSIGPPEWDLVSTAIKHTSFGWISAEQYEGFCRRYGHDVTGWPGFTLLRDIRELRMACYVAQAAAEDDQLHREANLRVRCLRGREGSRPWSWTTSA